MEWRFGVAIEDFVVPRDEEMFDCLSSPDGWNPWAKKFEHLNSPKKFSTAGAEDRLFSGATFYSEVEQLSGPNVCRGSGHAYSDEYSDVQVNDFSRFNEADDIFLHSLFKADASEISGAGISANTAQTSSQNDMLSVDLLEEGDHVGDYTYNVVEDYPFPEEMDPEMEACVSPGPSNVCEFTNEDKICLEESVLLELQRSMFQLAEDTRSCFRESLYRLAENTRQQVSCSQDTVDALEDCKPTCSGAPSRSEESNSNLSNTNAIDRTVATLLFNTMKSSYQPNPSISSLCSGDAEVPTFGSMCHPMQP